MSLSYTLVSDLTCFASYLRNGKIERTQHIMLRDNMLSAKHIEQEEASANRTLFMCEWKNY